jgi:hypothetical protein
MSHYTNAAHDIRVVTFRTMEAMLGYNLAGYMNGEMVDLDGPIADTLWTVLATPLPDGLKWGSFFPRDNPRGGDNAWAIWVAAMDKWVAAPDDSRDLPAVPDPDSAQWRDVFLTDHMGERSAETFQAWATRGGLCNGYNVVSAAMQDEFVCSPTIAYTEVESPEVRAERIAEELQVIESGIVETS